MEILFTPYMTIPALSDADRRQILTAAPQDSRLLESDSVSEQIRLISNADILLGRVSPEIFDKQTKLKYYHFIGAGVDSVLTGTLPHTNVLLACDKGQVGPQLAEHAFALLLTLTRQVHTAVRTPDYQLRESLRVLSRELQHQTMGILGFGGAGRAIAQRAMAFGMRVLAIDIEDVPPEAGVDAIWRPECLPDLLAQSDVVVIALPLTTLTRGLLNRTTFAQMKPDSILINVTRGAIVDCGDLLTALDSGKLWGAGLDVTAPEPLPENHPLWRHPRCVITPHTAGGSPKRKERIVQAFCMNLKRLQRNEPLLGLVDKERGY